MQTMSHNLSIPLKTKLDRDGRKYLVGKLKAPITIDCSEGICLICFVSEEGAEELQLCSINNKEYQ
jgi:hypothetical protein